jgi:transposase InsO family protein
MVKRRDCSKLGEVVQKIQELGLSYREGAERFGVKVRDVYKYNQRMKKKAAEANRGKSETRASSGQVQETGQVQDTGRTQETRPAENTAATNRGAQLPAGVQELIRRYRREQPTHGFKRIADLLKEKYLVVVTRKQIRQVLKEANLLETCDSSFDKEPTPAKGSRRFEAPAPGQLWQMDVAYVYIQKIPVLYLVVIVDDHSRFCVAAELCRDQRGDTLIGVLHHACTAYGTPKQLLTDQGSGFYSWSREQTQFQHYLDDQRIEHLVSEPHSPQTQGKVERLIQTLRSELLSRVKFAGFADAQAQIHSFVHSYNFDRPHQGIGGKRPADRFHGVLGEVEQAQAELAGRDIDLSRGYVVYQVRGRRVCIVCAPAGLQVYLDGMLLKEANDERGQH